MHVKGITLQYIQYLYEPLYYRANKLTYSTSKVWVKHSFFFTWLCVDGGGWKVWVTFIYLVLL